MIKNLKVRHSLIAVAVTLFLSFGFGILQAITGISLPVWPAVVLGGAVYFTLQARSSNREETRVDDASREAALRAVAPPGQALLYIYREGFLGKAVGFNVSLDGSALVQLRTPRFTQTTLRPGAHTLAVGVPGFAGTEIKSKTVDGAFEAHAGEVIVFTMRQRIGAPPSFVREQDTQAAMRKFIKMPMVAPERNAGIAIA